MEYRQLGGSGLYVPALCLGTATFGGTNGFEGWGHTKVEEATRMVNLCLDAGVNLFDTADVYSNGLSEEILGKAIHGLRNRLLISTKATFNLSPESRNAIGSSRFHLIQACEASLRRLNTDHIDIYHMHGFDANTPVEETLRALDDLVTSGKVRYIACSNFSGWHLMKSLSVSKRYGWSGKYRRNNPIPTDGRVARGGSPIPDEATSYERLYDIVEVLEQVAEETGHSVAQCALNWLLQRPTVSSLIIGARTEEQLRQNLEAVGWSLSPEQVKRLDMASQTTPIYPYWHQAQFPELNSQLRF